jgi:two-component system chemotaxis sensor kinase CheA
MSIQDKQMLNDLVVESRDHLSSVEPDLLELEQKGEAVSDELINRIFRAVHSIKGGFGFFGIEHVTKLSHVMENALSKVRDKSLAVSSELVDSLLVGVDKLRLLLDDIDSADRIPINDELARHIHGSDKKYGPALIAKGIC